jgi:hypothetical protein
MAPLGTQTPNYLKIKTEMSKQATIIKIKSVAYSSQGSHTDQPEFGN